MTLIDLLTAMIFVMGPTGAWMSAKIAHSGPIGYLVSVPIGLAIGAGSVWLYRQGIFLLHNRFLRPELSPTKRTEVVATLVLIPFTLVCFVFSDLLSGWVSSAAIRHLSIQ